MLPTWVRNPCPSTLDEIVLDFVHSSGFSIVLRLCYANGDRAARPNDDGLQPDIIMEKEVCGNPSIEVLKRCCGNYLYTPFLRSISHIGPQITMGKLTIPGVKPNLLTCESRRYSVRGIVILITRFFSGDRSTTCSEPKIEEAFSVRASFQVLPGSTRIPSERARATACWVSFCERRDQSLPMLPTSVSQRQRSWSRKVSSKSA